MKKSKQIFSAVEIRRIPAPTIAQGKNARRGIVLTLDIAIAMTLLLVVIATAYSSFGSPSREGFDNQLMRSYLQDAATVMSKKGYLSDAAQQNASNTSGIREVLRATSPTVCMQVSGYGTVVGQGLAAYWKFDEDTGSVVTDSSGNGHVGSVFGGGSLAESGKSGHSFTTDGVNDYIDSGYDVSWDENTPITISFWAKPKAVAGNGTSNAGIMGKIYPHYEWAFYQSGDTVSLVYWNGSGGHSNGMDASWGSVLSPSRWAHLAYVWNGTGSSFYANGLLANTKIAANASANIDNSNSTLIGGHIYAWGDQYFNGSIDDVRIYTRALSADEVIQLYSNPSNILYVVDKPECAYSGGEVQALTVPFAANTNQLENAYYYATLRAWISGAG